MAVTVRPPGLGSLVAVTADRWGRFAVVAAGQDPKAGERGGAGGCDGQGGEVAQGELHGGQGAVAGYADVLFPVKETNYGRIQDERPWSAPMGCTLLRS